MQRIQFKGLLKVRTPKTESLKPRPELRMDGRSLNIIEEKLNKLKKIIPEAFTEGKVDLEKLKIALGEDIEFKDERYVLNWAGKSNAFRVLQIPSSATLTPCKEESVDFDTTENIFIEGENLEVLKVLQKSYFNKIKMIYIDPPYNTGNDTFIYPDKFSETKEEYLGRIGDKDQTGFMTREGLFRKNSKDSGHYHSNWLSMIHPRLFLACNLLRDDGVIFVSIDDNEVHNLRLLMNEVFGEENFVGDIIWNSTKSVTNTALISVSHTYNLVYAKSIDYFTENRYDFRLPETEEGFLNPDNDPRGDWKADPFQVGGIRPNQRYEIKNPNTGEIYMPNEGCSWKNEYKVFQKLIADNRIVFGKKGEAGPQRKRFLSEAKERGRVVKTLWIDLDTTTNATTKLKNLMGGNLFTNPKPIDLIQRFIQLSTDSTPDNIILDFFAGSATTAHAALDLNKEDNGRRKFICVQLPEKCDEKSEVYKADYKTIAEIGKERIRRVIKNIKKEQKDRLDFKGSEQSQDLGFKVFKLNESNFKIWRPKLDDEEELLKELELHTDPVCENAQTENILYELLLKSGISLTTKIEEKNNCYLVNDNEIILILEKINEKIIQFVLTQKPQKAITLDRLFENNDQLKTNTALQMKDADIDFKVV